MKHQCVDAKLLDLPIVELRRRLAFEDWKDEINHIKNEVVFSLFRLARQAGDKHKIGVLSESLSRRILARARGFVVESHIFPGLIGDLDDAASELTQFVWGKLLNSESDAIHAERAFGQLFKRRAIDFQRSLLSKKRTQQSSLDALDQSGEDEDAEGAERAVTSLQEAISPEDILIQKQELDRFRSVMHTVLTPVELATIEFLYDLNMPVKDVAKALGKDPKSIFNYKTKAFEKLKKELNK